MVAKFCLCVLVEGGDAARGGCCVSVLLPILGGARPRRGIVYSITVDIGAHGDCVEWFRLHSIVYSCFQWHRQYQSLSCSRRCDLVMCEVARELRVGAHSPTR
eukprot:10032873-Alexandrium_andersonii.AAC.1